LVLDFIEERLLEGWIKLGYVGESVGIAFSGEAV
jgi:hypothetical protein